jgi:hypothetical protein
MARDSPLELLHGTSVMAGISTHSLAADPHRKIILVVSLTTDIGETQLADKDPAEAHSHSVRDPQRAGADQRRADVFLLLSGAVH